MRLTRDLLGQLAPGIRQPHYPREQLVSGILHLGVGAFHRAHQAVYTDAVLGATGGNWMITGASLKTERAATELNPQHGLYSILVEDDAHSTISVVGSIKEVIHAAADVSAILSRIAATETKIVSLTVTEKGYCRNASNGTLLRDHPDIKADLANPRAPQSAIGYLVRGLAARRDANAGAVAILSCDNLPANGRALRSVTLELAQLIDSSLATWIDTHVSFPSSMVDRIVPAATNTLKDRIEAESGFRDEAATSTEPFTQWVIEDRFGAGRPDWNIAGAVFTTDATPFEAMKLRLLNGAHSAIAYLGHLAGFTFVSDCMDNTTFREFIRALMADEIKPTVEAPAGYSLEDYIDELLRRFENSRIRHRCLQIAIDGSQKLPQRQLPVISDRLKQGYPISRLSLAVAAWMIFATGEDLDGNPHELNDPLADELRRQVASSRDNQSLVGSLLQIDGMFGALAARPEFRDALVRQTALLREKGVIGAMRSLAAS